MHLDPNEYSNINDVDVPSPEPTGEPDEAWRPTDSRIAYRRDGISTKAVLASLVTMGVLGTGGFLLMHSFVRGDLSEGSGRAMAEPPAATSPPSLIPPPPPPPSAPFFLSPTATSERIPLKLFAGAASATPDVAETAVMPVSSTLKAAVDLAATPTPKVLSNVTVYPFPVLARQDVAPAQRSPSAHPSPPATALDESAGTNPYDEAPETTTTIAALRGPPQDYGAPQDSPVGGHGR